MTDFTIKPRIPPLNPRQILSMKEIGKKLTRDELLSIDGVNWHCKCLHNTGEWESNSIREANNTAHWACENRGMLALCTSTIENRLYRVNIKSNKP